MKQKPTNMHKRLAMGDTVKGYAKGGSIGCDPAVTASGGSKQPLVTARRNNGVKGMKSGGKTC